MDGGFVAVALEGGHGVGAEESEAFLAAFAADFDDIVAGVDVGDVEIDEFVDAEAGAVEGFEDVRYGVLAAQKGGLTREYNLSSLSLESFSDWLAQRRSRRG